MNSLFLIVTILASLARLCPAHGGSAYYSFQQQQTGSDQTTTTPPVDLAPPPVQQDLGTEDDTESINQEQNDGIIQQPSSQILPDSKASIGVGGVGFLQGSKQSSFTSSFENTPSEPEMESENLESDDMMMMMGPPPPIMSGGPDEEMSDEGSDPAQNETSSGEDPQEFKLYYKQDQISFVKANEFNSSSMSKVLMINGKPVDLSDEDSSNPALERLNDFVMNLQALMITFNKVGNGSASGSDGDGDDAGGKASSNITSSISVNKTESVVLRKKRQVSESKPVVGQSSDATTTTTSATTLMTTTKSNDDDDDDDGDDSDDGEDNDTNFVYFERF